jgi:hypothetical protein
MVDNESVTFGQGGGVVMGLTTDFDVRKSVTKSQVMNKETAMYASSDWRGNWAVEFEISEIEIWCSKEQGSF